MRSNLTARKYYGIVGDLTGLHAVEQFWGFYPDGYLSSIEVWSDTSMVEGKYNLPGTFISMTADETESVYTKMSDISTYAEERIAKFISGEEDVATQWDTFVSTIRSMGMDDVVAIYQAAYDRYLAR